MMKISLIPQRRDNALRLSMSGDILTVNGEDFDFSAVPDGATLPRDAVVCEWLASDVERIGGVLHLALILPTGYNAPEEARFPQPITVTSDGPIDLPPRSIEEGQA